MSELQYPARNVCIVLLTGLGDVIHGLPIVNALKADDPSRRITWVVEPMPSAALRHHPSIDEVVVYHKKQGLRGIRQLRRDLAGGRFDLAINFNVYIKSAWPTLLSGAPHRLGFGRDRAMEGTWLAANHHLPAGPRAHTQDLFFEFLQHLGLPKPETPEWRITFTPEERAEQARFVAENRPVVALVPASANAKKDWLADRYARVVDALERDFGYRTMLIGGPGAREQAIAREIMDRAEHTPIWALGDSVRRLMWLIDSAQLLIAPDTGPVHIARALGVPVVGLFGHTNPWRVGPYQAYEDLWIDRYTEPGEAPDPSNWMPKLGRMEDITVDDVLERVQRAVPRMRPRPVAGEG
ncbi:glycosyltransferase family 9 protein [Longimicrobium sp.]|uniref:glycosyltransferase family 9 protein n=1 Tax=Longimicrobium sp. TaxID=2029185 RepID=UPI002E2F070D|nr:glycosyltransferase family 9 protein [Longimicrobium sp.]HEX6039063.1 glycosyltransferase family 9 protein [Longimicrobium sp.]